MPANDPCGTQDIRGYTRRGLLALGWGVLAAGTGSAWAGHPAGRSVVTISPESLKKLVESQRAPVVLVDLRPAHEYRRGRLPGAVSMSSAEIEHRIADVPPLNIVVLYCACPVDDIAALYDRLRGRGHRNLLILQDGFAGWVSRGYPVEH